MIKEKIEYLSAYEIGERVNKGIYKAEEVLNYFISRIERINPHINAFTYLKIDEALEAAKKVDQRIANNEYVGPFAGVPFVMKDFLPSKKGWTSSYGGVKCLIHVDSFDSEFTSAMEEMGGIAIGKTNAPSFGFKGLTDNKLYGITNNPFDIRYNAGGSSGGTASAIASGMIPIGEGGDAGGSIRIPSAWNNLYGFKASVGMIPNISRPDAWAASHPYCVNGGLTKSVKDTALLLNKMVRYDPKDPLSIPKNNIDYVKEIENYNLQGIRIAYTDDFDLFEVDEEIKNKIYQHAKKLESLGAIVERVHFNFKHDVNDICSTWCHAISVDTAIDIINHQKEGFDLFEHEDELPEDFIIVNKEVIRSGIMDYYHFNVVRTDIYDQIENILKEYDYIISPTNIIKPVLNKGDVIKGPEMINGKASNPLIGFATTLLTNFTGHPSASIPAGILSDNMPVGLHVITHRFKDEDILRISKAFEDIAPWNEYYKLAME